MRIVTLEGIDEINDALTKAMGATVDALFLDGLLDKESANRFMDLHVCLLVDNSGGVWDRILSKIFPNRSKDRASILIVGVKPRDAPP